jgi:hypothetical protein
MGMGRRVTATRRQLEMRAGSWNLEEHTVVSVVIVESADLGEPHAVAVERDDFTETICVTSNAQFHRSA